MYPPLDLGSCFKVMLWRVSSDSVIFVAFRKIMCLERQIMLGVFYQG